MKCSEIQDLFGIYFDLPETDMRRRQVDEHVARCEECREEFEIWRESTELILMAKDEPVPLLPTAPLTRNVMDRIYKDESWRLPVANRIYAIPYKLRRNLTAFIALCLAVFMISFLFSLTDSGGKKSAEAETVSAYGFKQVARASANPADALNVHTMTRPTLASAGPTIIDPVKVGPIRTVPDYLLTLSILGLISALLTMNWLARTRA